MPKTVAPQKLIDEAKQADLRFRACWHGLRENKRELGRVCTEIQEKDLYKYIARPGSKTGYQTFDGYVASATGGECPKSTYQDAMELFKLTQGAVALPPEVVDSMATKNALQLSRVIKSLPAKKKTKKNIAEIVEKAQTQPVLKFKVTAQEAINENLPTGERRQVRTMLKFYVVPEVAEKFEATVEDFKLLTGIVLDANLEMDILSKAIETIRVCAEAHASEALKAVKEKARREAPVLSETKHEATEADATEEGLEYNAPDAGELIGKAFDERRVITKSEATH